MDKIMIVDDNMANLIFARKSLEDTYEVIPVSSGISALECLKDMPELPDVILLDIDMPNVNGFMVISEIKNTLKLSKIPIIFLTAQEDDVTELEGYNLGAIDYVKKPFTVSILKKRIDIQLQIVHQRRKIKEFTDNLSSAIQEKDRKIAEVQNNVGEMLVDLLDKRDAYAGNHVRRVEKLLEAFLSYLVRNGKCKLSADDVVAMAYASKLHDIGKISLKDDIIEATYSPEKSSKFLVDALKTHTYLGADCISKITNVSNNSMFITYAYNMCKYHHENWDGSGYPEKLDQEDIPFEARALAIVNFYDQLVNHKASDKRLSHKEALMRIKFLKFTMFDPKLVDDFILAERDILQVFA